jgi:catechol 2,3-dioxygenase-like lactoylglutathione lyase family enzyme
LKSPETNIKISDRVFEKQIMPLTIELMTLVVKDYDEAIDYYINRLGFILIEDTKLSNRKRWVVVAPAVNSPVKILLARADNSEQESRIGNQTGGRVFLFLKTDDFEKTYKQFKENGVDFLEEPRKEIYGTVVVFRDLYGNKWDLIGQ